MNLGQWIGFLALAAALYILWQLRQVLLLVFAAVVLANSLNLLAKYLQQLGVKRSASVLLSVGSFVGVIAGFIWLIVPPFATQFQELIVLLPKGIDVLDARVNSLIRLVPSHFSPYLPDLNSLVQQTQPYLNRLLGGSLALFSSSLGVVVNILLVLVLALMLLLNPLAYRQGFIRLFPAFYRRRIDAILVECEVALGRWIEGALISMSVVAVLSSLGLSLIGVRAALAQGVLAGLLNFIPNIGPTLSVVLPMSIALLDSPLKPLFVLALYIVIQQFESNLLTPYVMAQQVALLPAVTLLAQVFFATIFGFLGLALALPLTVVSQIWIRRVLLEDVMDQWGSNAKKTPEPPSTASLPEDYYPSTYAETVLQSPAPVDVPDQEAADESELKEDAASKEPRSE